MTIPSGSNASQRPLYRRIFLEPDGLRLRSGWRVLIHGLLALLLSLILSIIVGTIGALLGLVDLAVADPASIESPLLLLGPLVGISLATWLARRFLDRRSFESLGFQLDEHAWPDLLFGTLMPAGLFALIFLFELSLGWLKIEGTAFGNYSFFGAIGRLVQGLVFFIIVGYQEELLSRGYQLQNLAGGLGLPLGVLVTSAIFAILHIWNPSASVFSTLGILAAGLYLALGWLRTGRLWLPIGLHIGWNFFQGTIFGFPVSGTSGFHLIEHSVNGPTFVTGGPFGPEAGLTGLLAMVLGSYAIWRYTEGRGGPLEAELASLEEASVMPSPSGPSNPESH